MDNLGFAELLGKLLLQQKRHTEASDLYRHALAPGHRLIRLLKLKLQMNWKFAELLGKLLLQQKRDTEASELCRHAPNRKDMLRGTAGALHICGWGAPSQLHRPANFCPKAQPHR